jgi:hypothetical protein
VPQRRRGDLYSHHRHERDAAPRAGVPALIAPVS